MARCTHSIASQPARWLAPLLALLLVPVLAASCNGQAANRPQPPSESTLPTDPAPFDQARAWEALTTQCDFGSRVPGSEAHRLCGDWLLEQLAASCDRTMAQEFTHRSTGVFPGQSFAMRNLIGVIDGDPDSATASRQVLLVAHWDSRPFCDQEADPAKRRQPVPGANDGASGVAVALEIARCLALQRPPITVVFLLTDGEDFGSTGDPWLREWFLGAKRFAADRMGLDPKRGILLDMVGDKNVEIGREWESVDADPTLVDRIWTIARRLGHDDVFVDTDYGVSDDHLPLIDSGIPVVDLIDWRREVTGTYWHTLDDTPERCSAESLGKVGAVVLTVLREGI